VHPIIDINFDFLFCHQLSFIIHTEQCSNTVT